MTWRMLRAIVALPTPVIVVVPVLLVWASTGTPYGARPAEPGTLWFWLALVAAALAVALMVSTVRLLMVRGKGTPAPWDPPARLVVAGPYRYVRNPMLAGVVLFLLAEALALRSWPVAVWTAVFFAAASVLFVFFEEPGLERRFGDTYRAYRANVRRWLPRLTPWRAS